MHVSLATTLTTRGAKKGDPVRSEGSRSIRGKKKRKERGIAEEKCPRK